MSVTAFQDLPLADRGPDYRVAPSVRFALGIPNNLRRRETTMSRSVRSLLAVLAVVVLAAPAAAHNGEVHPPPVPPAGQRIGVLLADHGEPPEYNEDTYESFREFFEHLLEMEVVPSWSRHVDTGTILHDARCPGCDEPSTSPRLIDAWLRPHDGPAAFVPASDTIPAHYVLPAGPGLREPDIFEHVGLGAWHEWQQMGGRSPNYDEKLAKKNAVIQRLEAAFGDRVVVRVGYGIDPRIGGGRQGIREALEALVNRDRITELAVVYHGVGFSDIMQTHHLRHQISEHLGHLGASKLPVRYAAPLGTTDAYVQAVVQKVGAELAAVPADVPVAIHLSGHGLPTTTCGGYDCGADPYHQHSAALFARVKPAILATIDRPGRTEIFHTYGDGATGDDDPQDKVASPIEALDARRAAGFRFVIDVPFEFDSNSRDTLIVLRRGYGRPSPDWNARWESAFTYKGLRVKIANALGGEVLKTAALDLVARAAIGRAGTPSGGSPHH